MASDVIFSLQQVSFAYPAGTQALADISFDIRRGESVAIAGANSSGKSTLLKLLDGLLFATSGTVVALGTPLTETAVETPPFCREFRRQVGLLFQNPDVQLFNPTTREELAFGPLQLEVSEKETERRVADIAHLVGIEHLLDRSPASLSSGEKRLVALASLLTCAPRVLLLDEPTAGLDPRNQRWLIDFLKELRADGVTLVIASHDLSFVFDTSDRAVILSEDHRLAADGPAHKVLADADLLLDVNLIHEHTHRHGDAFHTHLHRHDPSHKHPHDTNP